MGIKKSLQDTFLFLNKFLYKPGQIGSVTPSSKYLAKKMVETVPWNEVKSIAELGAGTGAITKQIQSVLRKNTKVLLFEADPYMLKELERQFPAFLSYQNTIELQSALQKEGIDQLDCIICGLPFFNFSQVLRDKLLEQILASLKERGLFIAFQYSQQMKKQLANHFDIEQIKFVPLNVPPAFVYICRKRQKAAQ